MNPDEENQAPKKLSKKRPIIITISVLFLLLYTIAALSYFKIIHLPLPSANNFPTPAVSTTTSTTDSSPLLSIFDLKTCRFSRKDNPLLITFTIYPDVMVGIFEGTITALTPNGNTALLTLTTADKTQSHAFTIDNTIPVYNKTQKQILTFSDLQQGQTVDLQFNCHAEKGNSVQFTDIGIIQ